MQSVNELMLVANNFAENLQSNFIVTHESYDENKSTIRRDF